MTNMKVVSVVCLFVVTLAYVGAQYPPVPADGNCEPGKAYQQDCNTCTCGRNGKIGGCTYKLCLPPRSKRAAESSPYPPVPADGSCEAGKVYQQDCNTCTCGRDGKIGGCTYKLCLSPRSKRADEVKLLRDLPSDGKCEAGKSYRVDCNICTCDVNGKLAACTLKACLKPKRSADQYQCSVGQVKQESCNTCHCANGVWACTRKLCPEARGKREAEPQECSEGDVKQADCNTCHCTSGLWTCTRKACVTPRARRSPQQCYQGQVQQQDCNTCHCANGVWACTRRLCPGVRSKRDSKTSHCEDGQTKQINCNTCRCFGNAWACTLEGCVEPPKPIPSAGNQVCTVGDSKKEDCNTCRCVQFKSGDTDWACTQMRCIQLRPKRDVAVTSDLKNTPCAPNDYFKIDCNTCYCNSAKTGYLCTNHICAPDNSTEPAIPQTTTVASSESRIICDSTTVPSTTVAVEASSGSSTTPETVLSSSSTTARPIDIVKVAENSTETVKLPADDTEG